jgi:hypothetical protein
LLDGLSGGFWLDYSDGLVLSLLDGLLGGLSGRFG